MARIIAKINGKRFSSSKIYFRFTGMEQNLTNFDLKNSTPPDRSGRVDSASIYHPGSRGFKSHSHMAFIQFNPQYQTSREYLSTVSDSRKMVKFLIVNIHSNII